MNKRIFETTNHQALQIEDNGEDSSPESQKGEKPAWRGKCENAISGKQLDSVREETHVVSLMIPRLETDAIRDKKDNRLLLHQKRRHGSQR